MVIRPYDPCFSCGTHTLQGKVAIRLDICGPDGRLMDTMTNY